MGLRLVNLGTLLIRKKIKSMAKKHIHRYERKKIGENYIVFRCNLPKCTHYLPKQLVKGKVSLCNKCGNEFILTSGSLLLAKPHCEDCTVHKDNEHDRLKELLERTMP